ncbi:MAG: hypothetical protein U1E81_20025 [Xanthobacteraceae bacterium]
MTLGQIGYGDAVLVTPLGRAGRGHDDLYRPHHDRAADRHRRHRLFRQVHRRAFIVTFSMVARVPLFAELDASQIADIHGRCACRRSIREK